MIVLNYKQLDKAPLRKRPRIFQCGQKEDGAAKRIAAESKRTVRMPDGESPRSCHCLMAFSALTCADGTEAHRCHGHPTPKHSASQAICRLWRAVDGCAWRPDMSGHPLCLRQCDHAIGSASAKAVSNAMFAAPGSYVSSRSVLSHIRLPWRGRAGRCPCSLRGANLPFSAERPLQLPVQLLLQDVGFPFFTALKFQSTPPMSKFCKTLT